MKIYLAGKITGDPNYREKFEKYASLLRQQGHIVLNPAILPDGLEHTEYLHICISMVDVSDVVHFLPDWQESLGACMEYEYCKENGKPTHFA